MTGLSTKGARTRAAILDAAEAAFASSGFHGASVRDLAAAANMATAGLLHHFPRKEGLYDEVLGRIADDIDAVITESLCGDATPASKLRRMVSRYHAWAQAHPSRSNLLLRELLDNPSRLGRAGRFHLAPVVDKMTAFIAAGRREGVFAAVDPLMFVVHLAGSTSYFIAARPTLARIENKSETTLDRRFRRDLLALVQRHVLEPP
jgi:AcrR family transcriptional regulator